MAEELLHLESVSQLHRLLGLEKPKHPSVSLLEVPDLKTPDSLIGQKIVSSLYSISMKSSECGLDYGRHHIDFDEGVMVFTGPQQVIAATSGTSPDDEGWILFFHPDLIRKSHLGEIIEEYSFFSYEAHEALHLSDDEKSVLYDCVQKIRQEYEQRIDNHSQRVIITTLELLLNYCLRFYERQFNTRTSQNKDILTRFEKLLKGYFSSDQLTLKGLPSIQYFAEQVHLSPNYLSDLLKKESGRSAKDHINDYVVEKAKYMLLNSEDTISGIAYSLGFNYPHYFSRLFKAKTGITPLDYRSLN